MKIKDIVEYTGALIGLAGIAIEYMGISLESKVTETIGLNMMRAGLLTVSGTYFYDRILDWKSQR